MGGYFGIEAISRNAEVFLTLRHVIGARQHAAVAAQRQIAPEQPLAQIGKDHAASDVADRRDRISREGLERNPVVGRDVIEGARPEHVAGRLAQEPEVDIELAAGGRSKTSAH